MDDLFAGVFAAVEADMLDNARMVIANALETWPGCRGEIAYDPFIGIAVASPGFHRSNQEHYEQSIELAGQIEDGLPAWSRQFPKLQFVFVRMEGWGWATEVRGYVCQDGIITQRSTDENALQELVAVLGVTLGPTKYFPPLSHSFYW
jgi:hypothetical protein